MMMTMLNSFGSISFEDGLDLQIGDQELVTQSLGESRYAYRRSKAGKPLLERIFVSIDETPQIAVYPCPPDSTPQRIAERLLLKLSSPVILQPEATAKSFLTAPFEVGLYTTSRTRGSPMRE